MLIEQTENSRDLQDIILKTPLKFHLQNVFPLATYHPCDFPVATVLTRIRPVGLQHYVPCEIWSCLTKSQAIHAAISVGIPTDWQQISRVTNRKGGFLKQRGDTRGRSETICSQTMHWKPGHRAGGKCCQVLPLHSSPAHVGSFWGLPTQSYAVILVSLKYCLRLQGSPAVLTG